MRKEENYEDYFEKTSRNSFDKLKKLSDMNESKTEEEWNELFHSILEENKKGADKIFK